MEREEKASLLSSGSEEDQNGFAPAYGTEQHNGDSSRTTGKGSTTNGDTNSKAARAFWKRERKLQRSPSLDKVDEDMDPELESKDTWRKSSRDRLFGVKSYLHHFYQGRGDKDPTVYEDEDDFDYLLGNPRKRRCTSIWWKVFVWIGANFLIFGIIGVLVGYLVPEKPIFIGKLTPHMLIEDHDAISYNANLDVCKIVGLILFCIGGLTLAVALLFPSFLYHYCDDGRDTPIKVQLGDEKPATSPLEMQIPASSIISEVQPERKSKESIVTREGMMPFQD